MAYYVVFKCVNSGMLLKAAVAPVNVQTQIGQMLDSITCTTIPPEVHQWCNDTIVSVAQGIQRPQAVEMEVPDASVDYATFIFIGMKKSLMWGLHGHGFLCEKGKKANLCVV